MMQVLLILLWLLLTLLLMATLGRTIARLDDVEAQLGLQQGKSDALAELVHRMDRHIHHNEGGVRRDA